jgi:hypothetical protein
MHESVRPAFADDVTVSLRLRPSALRDLRAGFEVRHVRLDAVPDEDATYDVYVETAQEIAAVPAWDAPHSECFRDERTGAPHNG